MLEHFPTIAPTTKPITKVYVIVTGIPRRKRSFQTLSLELATYPEHRYLNPDELNMLERQAWQRIDEEKLRGLGKTARLSVCKGSDYGNGLESVHLMPQQQQTIMR